MSAVIAVFRALAIGMLATTIIAGRPLIAHADGTMRVLLADADPELQRAVKATLAPWRAEVIVEAEQHPSDTTHAQMIGMAQTARFVVWRERGDLVVYDRERGTAEHRAAPAGALDPASAAAAALTVKTLMRLPPPEQVAMVTTEPPMRIDTAPPAVTHDASGALLRAQAGIATRMTRGDQNDFGARAMFAVMVKPSSFALRLGVAGEFGTETDVDGSGFKGRWRDWSVIGLASWAIELAPRWEIEPYVGAGALRSSLDGELGMTERHERETLVTLRAGAFVRRQLGAFSIGAALGFDATPGTPTYTKGGAGSKFFEVPPFALSVGAIFAADLGR